MTSMMQRFRWLLLVVVLGAAFSSAPSIAAAPPAGPPPPAAPVDPNANPQAKANFDEVLTEYHTAAQGWQNILSQYAQRLFWLLAFIELVWTAAKLVLRGADFGEFVTEVVKYILFVGFFAALMFNASVWANDIIDSFQQAAVNASIAGGHSAASVSPSDIFASGLNIVAQIDQQASGWHPIKALGIFIAALIIICLFAGIATMIVLGWIETYFVIYAAIFFTGFGGSRFTSDYAKRMLMLAVTAGSKLFVLLLLAGLLQTLAQKWADAAQSGTDPAVLGLVGLSLMGAFLCVRIPGLIQTLATGQVSGSSGLMAAAGTMVSAGAALGVAAASLKEAGGALAKGAQGAHGAGMAMSAASSLASSQGGGGPGGMAGAASHVGRTLGNLGSAAMGQAKSGVQNLGGPLSARSANGGAGNVGSRMADSMKAKQAEMTKPTASPSSQASSAPSASPASPAAGGGSNAEDGGGSISGAGDPPPAPASESAPAGGGGTADAGSVDASSGAPGAADTSSGSTTSSGGGQPSAGDPNSSAASPTPQQSGKSREGKGELTDALRNFGHHIKKHDTDE